MKMARSHLRPLHIQRADSPDSDSVLIGLDTRGLSLGSLFASTAQALSLPVSKIERIYICVDNVSTLLNETTLHNIISGMASALLVFTHMIEIQVFKDYDGLKMNVCVDSRCSKEELVFAINNELFLRSVINMDYRVVVQMHTDVDEILIPIDDASISLLNAIDNRVYIETRPYKYDNIW